MGPSSEFLWVVLLLKFCGAGWGQLTDNTPPVIFLDRNWVIQDTDPVGEVITRVKAEDPEKDHLEYGLEAKGYNGAGSPDRPLPFTINSTTGVVKINESLINRGGEQLFLYVTVFDGQVTSKSEVWARIRNSSAAPNSTELNNERPSPGTTVFLPNFRPQFPGGGKSGSGNIPSDFIQPPPPLPDISRKPRPPPPPPPPPLSPEQTTLRAATTAAAKQPTSAEATEAVMTPPPGGGGPHHNVTPSGGTVTSVPDLTATVIPISVMCGIFIMGGAITWLFRRKLCCYQNKGNKDDMASA